MYEGIQGACMTCAKGPEVLDGLGYGLPEQADDDATNSLPVNLDVEEDLVGDLL